MQSFHSTLKGLMYYYLLLPRIASGAIHILAIRASARFYPIYTLIEHSGTCVETIMHSLKQFDSEP